MIVYLERLITLLLCSYLNYIVAVSPNLKNEMGALPTDKPFKGGEAKNVNLIRIILSLIMLPLVFYNSNQYLYFFSICEIVLICSLIGGYLLRITCFKQLGLLFTFGLGIREDHKLVTTGPYKYLIHPSYTGQLLVHYSYWALLFLGHDFVILNTAFYLLVLYSFYTVLHRIRLEEQMMRRYFGKAYDKYVSKRYRFIPYIF
jgi:protein-S-isoprenylcysteine O-methyltransferase Ste14